MSETSQPNALSRAAADLFPGYFALVMATGIISIACFLLEMKTISLVLLIIDIVAYLVLWLLLVSRLLFFFPRVKADIQDHVRGPGFFTVVAGTCVLGSALLIVVDRYRPAMVLWFAGISLWIVIICTFQLSHAINFPLLLVIPRYFIYLALAGWIAASLGLMGTLVRAAPRVNTKTVRLFLLTLFLSGSIAAQPSESVMAQSNYSLRSPDQRIEVQIRAADRLSYDVLLNGNLLLQNSTLSMNINHANLGAQPRVRATKQRSENREIVSAVPQKSVRIREHYNELKLEMEGDYSVVFRAFNEGVAYRFETSLAANEAKVYTEEVRLNFAGDYNVYYPQEDSFFSHNEREFLNLPLKQIASTTLASLPAVVVTSNGVKIPIAESDVEDYPGLWLRGANNNALEGVFPPYPLKEDLRKNSDRDFQVTESADYIALTKGARTFPWRIIGIAEKDADLITNQLVYLLAKPSQVQDTSWIKPGKVAWDWYNANNIYDVDFKSGINTQTYKYYIDFASRYGIEYVILDEGWYKLGNLLEVVPEIDIEELVAYGKRKNVGIILWMVWKTLDDQFEAAFNEAEKWGVKGLKIDFMQRDDQLVINFYHKVCREAARRRMLVDFHGAIRPATMTRTWPNLVNVEGVRGLEQTKWSKYANPEHNVTLPFTRMLLGPMDYTPGAMVNSGRERNFAPIFERPMSLGTRVHQLAMYVIYEAPLQMLADSPSHYLREPKVMEFLKPVPTVWDETRVLAAKMGDYVCIARRSGRDWYIGAMTDWTSRTLDIDFSFLPAGRFQMLAYEDGPNADRMGHDYKAVTKDIDRTKKLTINLASGGGWVARIYRTKSERDATGLSRGVSR